MIRQPAPFARRLNDLREAAEISRPALARRSGISRQTLSQLESGEKEPSWDEVCRLARAIGTDLATFDGDEGPGLDRLVAAARAYARAYDGAEQQGRNGAAQDPEVFGRFQDAQVELNLAALDLFAAEAVCPVRAAAHQQSQVSAPPARTTSRRKPARK